MTTETKRLDLDAIAAHAELRRYVDDKDHGQSCVNPFWSEIARDGLRSLAAEVTRLRGLIKSAERTRAPQCFECPWCQADIDAHEKHAGCEAFLPSGEVR